MANNKKTISGLLLSTVGWIAAILFLGMQPVVAQETISTTGGTAKGSGGTATFTIGQPFYQTHQGEGGSIAEGVQQPYEIYLETAVNDLIFLSMSAFPNPVADRLTLRIDEPGDLSAAGYQFQLFDNLGRLLIHDRIINQQTYIDMSSFDPAVYIIRVSDSKRDVATFRVIKR
jgi:hypothetical protein